MALERISVPGYGRFYQLPDAKWYPSTTTILDAVAKPALQYWAASEERKLCVQSARILYDRLPGKVDTEEFVRQLDAEIGSIRGAERAKNRAADYGTKVHNYIEWDLKRELGLSVPEKPSLPEGGQLSWRSYRNFRRQNKLHVRLIEAPAYSMKNGHGGTTDWVAISKLYGRDVVGDWKTSKSMHSEQTLQAASYVMSLIEMNTLVGEVDALIVRLPKEGASPEVESKHVAWEVIPQLYQVFLAYKEAWYWQHPDWEAALHKELEKEEKKKQKAAA